MIPRVLGIDPSLKATGICLPTGETFTIKTGDATIGDRRLLILEKGLRHYLRIAGAVDLAVVEVPGNMGGFQSIDAALAAGMAQGAVWTRLVEFGIPFGLINPIKVKMFAAGKGSADKREMIAACNRHRAGRLVEPITDDNQADAWWLRQMGLWHLGSKTLDPAADTILNSGTVRDAAIKPAKGVKWPGART